MDCPLFHSFFPVLLDSLVGEEEMYTSVGLGTLAGRKNA